MIASFSSILFSSSVRSFTIRGLMTRYAPMKTSSLVFELNPETRYAIQDQQKTYYSSYQVQQSNRYILSSIIERKNHLVFKRFKKAKGRSRNAQEDDEADEEENDDDDAEIAGENPLLVDDLLGKSSDGSQYMQIDVNSLRLDAVAKVAFAMTRAKVEESYYKGYIYINGERAIKKSQDLSINDEIDLVKQINPEDPLKLDIRRCQIVKLPDKASQQGRFKLGVKRWLELTIDAHENR